jgi:hypothetical protein
MAPRYTLKHLYGTATHALEVTSWPSTSKLFLLSGFYHAGLHTLQHPNGIASQTSLIMLTPHLLFTNKSSSHSRLAQDVNKSFFQPKLTVNTPGDAHEQGSRPCG